MNDPVSFEKAERIRWVGDPTSLSGFNRPDRVSAQQGVFLFHIPKLGQFPSTEIRLMRAELAAGDPALDPPFSDPRLDQVIAAPRRVRRRVTTR